MFINFVYAKFPKQMSYVYYFNNNLEATSTKNLIPWQLLNDFYINYFKTYDLIFLLKLKRWFVEIKCGPIALPNVQRHVATVECFYHCPGCLKGTGLVTQFKAFLKITFLSAAEGQRPRNYSSCCCAWIFCLIYALSTSTTMLPPIFCITLSIYPSIHVAVFLSVNLSIDLFHSLNINL